MLLNASYEPLNICSWKRAVVLLIKGKAETIERNGKELAKDFPLPTVIRLLYYVRIPHKNIPLTRRNIMHRDNYMCQYCGKKSDLTIDHVHPRSRGGKDEWENVVAACLKCNVGKGARTPREAGMKLMKQPRKPKGFMDFEISKRRYVSKTPLSYWDKYTFQKE